MNDQPNENNSQPDQISRMEERFERRMERRANRGSRMGGSWIGGAVLILIGVVFLLQNQGLFYFQNWWALFILLPALGAFSNAWRAYQDAGYLDSHARGSLIVGALFCMVSVIFLFNLSWTLFGPAILILAGIGILFNAMQPGDSK